MVTTLSKFVAVWNGHIVSGFEFNSEKEWKQWKRQLGEAAKKRGESGRIFPNGTKLISIEDYEKGQY